MNILDEIKNDITGAQILKDWLGDGMTPVPLEQASARSVSCISGDEGKPCPHNKESRWWEKSKDIVAGYILEQLAVKKRMGVSVPLEENLKMCSLCGCAIALKVNVKIEFIKAHTSDEQVKQFPAWCWIRQEIENT